VIIKIRHFALSFLLHIWIAVILVVVVASEFIWMPISLERVLDNRISQFQLTLQISSRLGVHESSEQSRKIFLKQLNVQADKQGWQEIVYETQSKLRQQAQENNHLQLLLQRLPQSDYAYGLWFNPKQVLKDQAFLYRCFELLLMFFVTCILLTISLRRSSFLKSLNQVIAAAQSLAQGNFNAPFPAVHGSSVLAGLVKTFETTRISLAVMRRELLSQVEAKQLGEQRLQESHNVALIGSWEWKVAEDKIWFSKSLEKILGLDNIQKTTCLDEFFKQVHSADKNSLFKELKSDLTIDTTISTDFRVSNDGVIKHLHLMANVEKQKNGTIRLIGTCQDISDRKNIESLLQKLSSAITASGSGVIITDVIGTVEYINPKFTETTGFNIEELEGTTSLMLSRDCLPENKYDSMWKDILGGKSWRGDLQNIRKDGSSYWSIVSISPINNEYNELTHFVIVSEDVSELKDAHAKMEQLALYDELTGLPNRRLFFRELENLFLTDVMESPAVVMLLDLDNFKTVNDTQGHPAGDKLLIEVSRRIEQNITGKGLAARLGGDEFAMLINPVKNIKQVERIAQKVLELIAQPYIINETEIQISTSIGLAWLPKDGNMPDTIMKHADLAMYQAKEMGRNQFRQFTEQLNEQLQRYIRFSREMPEALLNGDFILNFQPKMDLKKQQIIGVEGLVRWQHPELGVISPVDFISIAEDTGFIVPLGNWVFAEACRSMKKLRDMGHPNISCAINVSLRQFRDPSLLGVIQKSMRDNDIDPRYIEVEITESLLMEDVDKAILTLREIQRIGISVAIDDFGTGYSSFSYLKNLPINVLKVDRCFIKDIPDSQEDMKITSAIISMAHSLNLKIVAEGIETDLQRQFLIEQDCDIGQGYLFGKPMTLQALKKLLDQNEGS
jgi:diguanylate cyclase (GGDEF)-like protein/PAS domain S-box-containing protein